MFGLLIRRLLTAVPVLLLLSFGIFSLTSLIPGNVAYVLAGPTGTAEDIQRIAHELGLDRPFLVRYFDWLNHALHFDFGNSLVDGSSIIGSLTDRFDYTFQLAVAAAIAGIVMGAPLAIVAALRPGSIFDHISRWFSSISLAMPSFWVGPLLLMFFAVKLRVLPANGFVLIQDSPTEFVLHAILPAITLGLILAATIIRLLRNSMLEVLDSNYIRTVWGKGASPRTVIGKHALRNAAIPAVTMFGILFGFLLGGTVITEQIFGINGVGNYALNAVRDRDVPVIEACTLFFGTVTICVNLLVDVTYALLNPKVRVN